MEFNQIIVTVDTKDIKSTNITDQLTPFYYLECLEKINVFSSNEITSCLLEELVKIMYDWEHTCFINYEMSEMLCEKYNIYKNNKNITNLPEIKFVKYIDFLEFRKEIIPIDFLLNCITRKPLLFKKSESLSIVGNSSHIVGSGLKDKIDSHDKIIRFNYGNIHRMYDNDLGEKTDLRVINGSIAKELVKYYTNNCGVVYSMNEQLRNELIYNSTRLIIADKDLSIEISNHYNIPVYTKNFSHEKVMKFMKPHKLKYWSVNHIREELKNNSYQITPTSGIIYISLFLNYINNINIYGIDPYEPVTEYNYINTKGKIITKEVTGKPKPNKTKCENCGYDHTVLLLLQKLNKIQIN